ncbi:MAG: RNA methyltransferase [Clostridiales bacterium]|nr:RNA methyltransferase [Clostridiales bacterium]
MNGVVTSLNNPAVKLVKSLYMKKYRDEHGLYFVEGFKMVGEALDEDIRIHMLLYSKDFNIGLLPLDGGNAHIQRICVDPAVFSRISDVKTPQGIIGIIEKNKYSVTHDLLEKKGFWVVLDRVQDPGNMGTIIRTIDAAGGDGVVLLKGCCDAYNPKSLRASMGSIFRIPVVGVEENRTFFSDLRRNGIDIVVSSINGDNIFEWSSHNTQGSGVLVIGNESAGVSSEIMDLADHVVSIPIYGGAESLNASVAAGILIYQLVGRYNAKA